MQGGWGVPIRRTPSPGDPVLLRNPAARLRRTGLAVLCLVLTAPAAASASHNAYLDVVRPNQAGCQVKGTLALPAPSDAPQGLSSNFYGYIVTAVTAAGEVSPACPPNVTRVDGTTNPPQNSVLVQWNATPGAVAYRIYRGTFDPINNQFVAPPQALVFAPGSPPATSLPATAVCPPGGTGNGPRCVFQDKGGPTAPQFPPAQAPEQTQSGSHPDLTIEQRNDYGGSNPNSPATDTSDDPYTVQNQPFTNALKSTQFSFPPGLLANPRATRDASGNVVVCKLTGPNSLLGDPNKFGSDDADEDRCPRNTLVGTVQSLTRTPQGLVPTAGDIYNGEIKGGEAARLFIVLRPACSADSFIAKQTASCNAINQGNPNPNKRAEVEKQFLAAVSTINARSAGVYGIDVNVVEAEDDHELASTLNVLLPIGPGGAYQRNAQAVIPVQVRRITQRLFGVADQGTADTSDDVPFVSLPTSCGTHTMGVTTTTHADATPDTGTNTFNTTGCENLPFTPEVEGTVDASGGQDKQGGHPALTVTVRQTEDEAATRSAKVTLPETLTANVAGLERPCASEEQLAANQCPAEATVGTATAKSPLLGEPLSGPIVAVAQASDLPKLVVLLRGQLSLRLEAFISLDTTTKPGEILIVNSFPSVPDLPLAEFTLNLKGGDRGLLTNADPLCQRTEAGSLSGTFTGHNGKDAAVSAPLRVVGSGTCPVVVIPDPKLTGRLKGVRRNRADLQLDVTRAGVIGVHRIGQVVVTLPKGLKINRRAARRRLVVTADGQRVPRSRYTVSSNGVTVHESAEGVNALRVRIRPRALRESRAIRRKGTRQRLTFRVRVLDYKPKAFPLSVRLKPRS